MFTGRRGEKNTVHGRSEGAEKSTGNFKEANFKHRVVKGGWNLTRKGGGFGSGSAGARGNSEFK